MLIRFYHPKDFGRLGNQMSWYYRVRSYCEQNGINFEIPRWLGEDIFEGVLHPITDAKPDLEWNNIALDFPVNRETSRRYFRLKAQFQMPSFPLVVHLRRGDYVEANPFHLIGIESYRRGVIDHGLEWNPVVVTDDVPFQFWKPEICDKKLAHGIDFGIMINAKNLFIANSTFSWWAGVLNRGSVFEPCEVSSETKTSTCRFHKWT